MMTMVTIITMIKGIRMIAGIGDKD